MQLHALWQIFLAAWLALVPCTGAAQDAIDITAPHTAEMLDRWDVEAASIEILLNQDPPDAGEIVDISDMLEEHLSVAPRLVAIADGLLGPLHEQLDALGPAPENEADEPAELASERKALAARIKRIEVLKKRAAQAEIRARALLDRLNERRRELFRNRLVERGPTLIQKGVLHGALLSISNVLSRLSSEIDRNLRRPGMEEDAAANIAGLIVLTVIGLFFMRRARREILRRLLSGIDENTPHSRRVAIAVGVTLARLVPPALSLAMVVAAIWSSGVLGFFGLQLLGGFAVAISLVIGAYALAGAYYSPKTPELRLSSLNDSAAAVAQRRIVLLTAVVGLDGIVVRRGQDIGLNIEALTLVNTGLLILGGLALWSLVHAASAESDAERGTKNIPGQTDEEDEEDEVDGEQVSDAEVLAGIGRILRASLLFASIAAPILALIGYYAASRYIFYPLVASTALIGLCVLVYHTLRELIDRIILDDSGDAGTDARREIHLVPIIVGTAIFLAAIPVLALIWGASVEDLKAAWRAAVEGVEIGEFVIAPVDFLAFLLVFSIGYVLTRMVQRVLTSSVLPLTRLDSGGRAAVRAGVGYFGITVSALIAISATSLNLSNLAIVAGALSVGIGFGLQNIVNNFVSGIILLIERPIKAGDWIELPSGMGYVKQVNVRSTEIQTFDRSSLIVPNSELISSTVINWTHDNMHGRIIVPVGVAYGTDTRKVERILLEIARAHPMLLRRPAPWIMFKGFGDSSMDFEIRAVLRDVNWVMNVKTDLNHEIARRFAEEGVEIPFPQRDLHLRSAVPVPVGGRTPDPAEAPQNGGGTEPEETREGNRE